MMQTGIQEQHSAVMEKAIAEHSLSRREIKCLLQSARGPATESLFYAARKLRQRYFGNQIFLYGFVYNSTHCRNNCNFCYYRKDNDKSIRYNKTRSEILEISFKLAESGVHMIDLTMGESEYMHQHNVEYVQKLCDIISDITIQTGLPVMISPGVVHGWALKQIADTGADWYACYQETHNQELFSQLRPGQDYQKRLSVKQTASELNMLIEEGILCGVGETFDDLLDSFEVIQKIDADQTRVMGFVPQVGTPMEKYPSAAVHRELVILAVLRLLFPDRLIPASLDVEGSNGLETRLAAGANVITSIVPAGKGLAGVAQNSLDIEDSRRTVAYVQKKILACGNYQIANHKDYRSWIAHRKQNRFNSCKSDPALKAI